MTVFQCFKFALPQIKLEIGGERDNINFGAVWNRIQVCNYPNMPHKFNLKTLKTQKLQTWRGLEPRTGL